MLDRSARGGRAGGAKSPRLLPIDFLGSVAEGDMPQLCPRQRERKGLPALARSLAEVLVIGMSERFLVRPDREGFSVYDVWTARSPLLP